MLVRSQESGRWWQLYYHIEYVTITQTWPVCVVVDICISIRRMSINSTFCVKSTLLISIGKTNYFVQNVCLRCFQNFVFRRASCGYHAKYILVSRGRPRIKPFANTTIEVKVLHEKHVTIWEKREICRRGQVWQASGTMCIIVIAVATRSIVSRYRFFLFWRNDCAYVLALV